METAQKLDETADADTGQFAPDALLASLSRFTGVQFAMAVAAQDKAKFEHWGCDDPPTLAGWIHDSSKSFRELGQTLQSGELQAIHALGQQRHLSILAADEESLGVGFTRALDLHQLRETFKQIEAKWAF